MIFFVCLGKEVCGKVTLKHIYEIALIKSQDPCLELMTLQQICQMMVGVAHSCGIEVVRDLDPVEYGTFLQERKGIIEDQRRQLQEKREAKMLRTA
jgi:large subunit ribosomal protein L11